MEDLNSTLSSIFGDPQKMEQLRQVAQSLGINTGAPTTQSQPFSQQPMQQEYAQQSQPFNQQQPMQQDHAQQSQPSNQPQPMQQEYAQQSQPSNQPQPMQQEYAQQSQQAFQQQSGAASGGFNPAAFAGMAEVIKTFNQRDKNVDLLQTLKPHFSSSRAGKIDDAVRIMQIIRAWPALRDSGMLGSLGNIFGGGGAK